VERAGAFASVLLDQRETELADPRDAALLHELVLGVLRRQGTLDFVTGRLSSRGVERLDPEVRVALRLGAYGLLYLDRVPPHAAVNSAVALVKGTSRRAAAGFVNGVLRALTRQGRSALPAAPDRGDVEGLAIHHSHPCWWVRRLVGRIGWDAAARLLGTQNEPAQTVVRVNRRRTSSAELATALRESGLVTRPGRIAPDSLRIESGAVRRTPLLHRGHFWVQDEGSQLVGCMFGGRVGPRVADLCAAPGGKTLQLAEVLEDGGTLVAVDRHRGRLGRLTRAATRLGARSVLAVQADMTRKVPFRGRFHQVLLDAPCSGTGTLRRHPEIRWRLRAEDLKLLAKRQARLLETAADLTEAGGTLVYSEAVRAFLQSHPEFRLGDPRNNLPPAAAGLVDADGFLRTSPLREGLDGFFAALLIRDERGRARGSHRPTAYNATARP
jgi:16S rRNA (cytosine967-C5)-methyltransferase